jgi:hypothetical protein
MLFAALTALLASASLLGQEPEAPKPPSATGAPTEAAAPKSTSADVEQLRQRIHEMRKSVLLGGEKVQQAQAEAADFYKRKITDLEQQLDATQAELSEKRAAYQIALDRALGDGTADRAAAIREAAGLRARITALEHDSQTFDHQSKQLSSMIRAVEAHGRERERLAARLESAGDPAELLSLPLPPVGLAPDLPEEPGELRLDQDLVSDLLRRDERRARHVLFEADPRRYWELFPLRPPAAPLTEAMTFPPADLPGQR